MVNYGDCNNGFGDVFHTRFREEANGSVRNESVIIDATFSAYGRNERYPISSYVSEVSDGEEPGKQPGVMFQWRPATANHIPLGFATCLRITYWKECGYSIDLPAIGDWAKRGWNQEMQAFSEFPWGLPKAPFETDSSILSLGAIDRGLLAASWELFWDIRAVHADLHRSANDVACAVENLRNTDGRVALEVQLTEALWHSECVKSMLAEFTAPKQVGATCYANACAAAIYHANCRILGRRKLSFEQLREKLISRFGYHGAYLENVLSEATFWNLGGRLHYQEVNEAQAREILSRRRHPLVAMFALTNKQWGRFSEFCRHFPYSSMPEAWIEGTGGGLHFATGNVASDAAQGICGHAVLATSVDEQGNLVLLNSWGTDFANNGSFKIKSGAVLNLRFFHVYFLESDLSVHERESYRLTINYIYAVQKCARGKSPFRPSITR